MAATSVIVCALCLLLAGGPTTAKAIAPYQPGSLGFDISFPQCPANFPANAGFAIIGVTDGRPWTTNPCLAAEFKWADQLQSPAAFYINTANSGPINPNWQVPGPKTCLDRASYDDLGCSYNFGWGGAAQAFATALNTSPNAASYPWWLDVETSNSWNGSPTANSASIQGSFDYLTSKGVAVVGVYSTGRQWATITGGYKLAGAPNWIAGATDAAGAFSSCNASFSGGPVWLVQFRVSGFYGDYACGAGAPGAPPLGGQVAPPTVVVPIAPAPATLSFPEADCAGNQANLAFSWTPGPAGDMQWLDISLQDNGFAPGTFVSAGPFSLAQGGFTWNGFSVGAPYFWRINTFTASGWLPSDTGAFVPCGGPQLLGATYTCTPDGHATVSLSFAPPSPAGSENWIDLSLYDNGFAPGTYGSVGPLDGKTTQFSWPGLSPNTNTYWRYNSLIDGQWSASPTGSFSAPC